MRCYILESLFILNKFYTVDSQLSGTRERTAKGIVQKWINATNYTKIMLQSVRFKHKINSEYFFKVHNDVK